MRNTRAWYVRTRRILTQYGIIELRARLAAALAELRRVRRERDQLDAAVTVSAASESALFERVWELEREMTALRQAPDSGGPGGFLLRAYDAVAADPPFNAPAADAP